MEPWRYSNTLLKAGLGERSLFHRHHRMGGTTSLVHNRGPSNGETVKLLKESNDEMKMASEATSSWYWLHDQLEEEGFNSFTIYPASAGYFARYY